MQVKTVRLYAPNGAALIVNAETEKLYRKLGYARRPTANSTDKEPEKAEVAEEEKAAAGQEKDAADKPSEEAVKSRPQTGAVK